MAKAKVKYKKQKQNASKSVNARSEKSPSAGGKSEYFEFERAHIQGRWRVLTPMHIGSGFTTRQPVGKENGSQEYADVANFCQDKAGMPYIPATSIRGLLRDIVSRLVKTEDKVLLEGLLGEALPENYDEQTEGEANGDVPNYHSRLRLYDATWDRSRSQSPIIEPVSAKPRIATHVVIDPLTRTAKPGLLFNKQEVPAGEEFVCDIELDRVTAEELQSVVNLLHTLSIESSLTRLGASANQLQGRICWAFNQETFSDGRSGIFVKVVTEKRFLAWLNSIDFKKPKTAVKDFHTLYSPASDIAVQCLDVIDDALEIPVKIYLQSPLLIPDVNLSKKHLSAVLAEKCPGKDNERDEALNGLKSMPDETGMVAKRPVLSNGRCTFEKRLVIPASSLLGAFRAQCRKILMTLAIETNTDRGAVKRQLSLSAINKAVDSVMRCFFGSTAQRSKIAISEAVSNDSPQEHHQFFNAIDRFTGGAADGALFNTMAYTCEYLTFTLRMDSALLKESGGALALISFALRDGVEGDIALGGGRAHGYGYNQMVIAAPDAPDSSSDSGENDNCLPADDCHEWRWQTNLQRLTALVERHSPGDAPSVSDDAEKLLIALQAALETQPAPTTEA